VTGVDSVKELIGLFTVIRVTGVVIAVQSRNEIIVDALNRIDHRFPIFRENEDLMNELTVDHHRCAKRFIDSRSECRAEPLTIDLPAPRSSNYP
jgi:hypothetical protein